MKSERRAIIYALVAVALWSTVATAFKIALQQVDVIHLLAGASTVSLCAFSLLLLQKKQLLNAIRALKTHWRMQLALGLINPIFYYLILFEAYRRLPAQVAQPINYTWAITLALLSVPLLKQKLSGYSLIGLAIGYGGVVIISMAGQQVTGTLDIVGLSLALISTLLWASYWLLNTKNSQDALTSLFQSFLIASPILIAAAMLFGSNTIIWHAKAVFSVLYVGLFEMGITFVFWQLALHHTQNTARIGSLIFLSPFVSLFLIHLILGEPLQLKTFFGLALIITGVVIAQKSTKVR